MLRSAIRIESLYDLRSAYQPCIRHKFLGGKQEFTMIVFEGSVRGILFIAVVLVKSIAEYHSVDFCFRS